MSRRASWALPRGCSGQVGTESASPPPLHTDQYFPAIIWKRLISEVHCIDSRLPWRSMHLGQSPGCLEEEPELESRGGRPGLSLTSQPQEGWGCCLTSWVGSER